MELIIAGRVAIVEIPVRLDAVTSPVVDGVMHHALKRPVDAIVCDFGNTDFLSSAGIRVLLTTRRELAKNNGRFLLCGIKPTVRDILDLTGFLPILEIFPTRISALDEVESLALDGETGQIIDI